MQGIRRGYLEERTKQGLVAPLEYLVDKPVYLFSGLDDVYVYQSVMRSVETQFRNLSAHVQTEFTLYAAHSWVVDAQTCAKPGVRPLTKAGQHAACCGIKGPTGSCITNISNFRPQGCCGKCSAGDEDLRNHTPIPKTPGWRPPINSCDYDMSGEILRWILGAHNVAARKAVVPNNLFSFQQARYLPANWTAERALLDERGYVYIPKACQLQPPPPLTRASQRAGGAAGGLAPLFSSNCTIHVHYHPCGGAYKQVGLAYMLENALPAYAEGNDMVCDDRCLK